ncbi:conserved phage C-terminal domain-containing protein [Streptococcus suis]|uniref:conserved phage C-terminal domain-containing protein n=1 Tax=Streptococcus suis TaxID=1307 RepID=UPI000CF64228|nr:conserved phage C-terminal domain-containing protein [Streptococcus suis]MCE6987278.1 conserved phage C-terminal domain-containing protein [Streptococcus suis]
MENGKTKVYFWLKVDKKFFDNLFIKRLKQTPGGYTMIVIYIRLMLESLEDDCILYYEGYFDNLVQELALKLDVTEDEINMTIAYFTKCGLIQIDGDGNATFSQAKAMIESETNHARYMRNSRKKKAEKLLEGNNVNQSLPISYPEIELEKDLDKEKDIELRDKRYILEKENILSGKPDYVFPTWLDETAIKTLEKTKNKELWIPIAYLNQIAEKRYKFIDKTKKLLTARFKDGYTLEDFKQVIDVKTAEWKDNPNFSKYLRPETLFGSKFDSYLNQKSKHIRADSGDNFPDLPF